MSSRPIDPHIVNNLVKVIMMHESERPDFMGTDYTEDEWNSITDAIMWCRSVLRIPD